MGRLYARETAAKRRICAQLVQPDAQLSKRRVLKDCSDLCSELAHRVAALALPLRLSFQPSHILAATGWAEHALGPAMVNHVADAVVGIGKVDDCFLKSLGRFHG